MHLDPGAAQPETVALARVHEAGRRGMLGEYGLAAVHPPEPYT